MKDGGPAFPRNVYHMEDNGGFPNNGMSLRDWFAGMALSGMLGTKGFTEYDPRAVVSDFTSWAYIYADAMLAEREKK